MDVLCTSLLVFGYSSARSMWADRFRWFAKHRWMHVSRNMNAIHNSKTNENKITAESPVTKKKKNKWFHGEIPESFRNVLPNHFQAISTNNRFSWKFSTFPLKAIIWFFTIHSTCSAYYFTCASARRRAVIVQQQRWAHNLENYTSANRPFKESMMCCVGGSVDSVSFQMAGVETK